MTSSESRDRSERTQSCLKEDACIIIIIITTIITIVTIITHPVNYSSVEVTSSNSGNLKSCFSFILLTTWNSSGWKPKPVIDSTLDF